MIQNEKRSIREILIRIVILFLGLTVAHFGVTLFLLSNLGADPFNVWIQGLYRVLSGSVSFLTHGYVHMAISFLIIVLLLVVDRTYIKIGTVICMFCGGPIIDFFTKIITAVLGEELSLPVKCVMLAFGCVILAFGMTIVIKSDAGTGPNDLVAIVISDKSGRRFGVVRIIVDFTFVAVGFVLGGTVGVGTVVCAFLVGPVADFFLPRNEKWIEKVIHSVCKHTDD